jgi:biotin carboxyl carrier protein
MKYFTKVSGRELQIEVVESDSGLALIVNGKAHHVELDRIGSDNLFSLIIDNRSHQLFLEETDTGHWVSVDGHKFFVELEDEKTRFIGGLIKSDAKPQRLTEIKAPMPGLIVKLFVKENQPVKKGDGLVIIEAMKMENEIRANGDSTVKKILLNEGDSVDKGAVLIIMK